jgi:AcrR family transcriptional regulator
VDALLVSKKTGTSERTRRALILAGEQLFGEQGIDGVSLRQINTAAGQKNSSAAHYHFGSKEALMRAVYEYRMERVNSRRLEMLVQLKADHRENDIRAIVETIVCPIVEEIEDSEGGSHYIRFLAQMMGHPRLVLDALWSSRFAEGLSSVVQLLKQSLPEIPAPLLYQRFGLMWEQTIHALADQEKISSGGNNGADRPANHSSIFVSNLVDTVAGGLSAPVSAATLAQLDIEKTITTK